MSTAWFWPFVALSGFAMLFSLVRSVLVVFEKGHALKIEQSALMQAHLRAAEQLDVQIKALGARVQALDNRTAKPVNPLVGR